MRREGVKSVRLSITSSLRNGKTKTKITDMEYRKLNSALSQILLMTLGKSL